MSKPYDNCLYQLYLHIINNDSTEFTANTIYNYLKTYHYSTANCCPVIGRIQSTSYDQQLLMIPFNFYQDINDKFNNDVIVDCVYINGNNIEGTPYDWLTFSCRNAVTNCNDTVIPLLDTSK